MLQPDHLIATSPSPLYYYIIAHRPSLIFTKKKLHHSITSFHHTINNIQLAFWFSVDGNFTQWTAWSQCSKTCGNGFQTRYRSCINPPPSNGGRDCVGPRNETQECIIEPCVRKSIYRCPDRCYWTSVRSARQNIGQVQCKKRTRSIFPSTDLTLVQ